MKIARKLLFVFRKLANLRVCEPITKMEIRILSQFLKELGSLAFEKRAPMEKEPKWSHIVQSGHTVPSMLHIRQLLLQGRRGPRISVKCALMLWIGRLDSKSTDVIHLSANLQ